MRDRARLRAVFALLEQSQSGRELLVKAREMWKAASNSELDSHFRWGSASRTDAILVRHFDSETGAESRERIVTIDLRPEQTQGELTLDVAHELVHATSRPAWDPYDPDLTAGKYISAAIDGKGGEVDAVLHECRVARELTSVYVAHGLKGRERCDSYAHVEGNAAAAEEAIRHDFYRVGRWKKNLVSHLSAQEIAILPRLSGEKPVLYSSTGGAPYPVALFDEFRQLNIAACDNSRKRAGLLQDASSLRAPASSSVSSNAVFLARRCTR